MLSTTTVFGMGSILAGVHDEGTRPSWASDMVRGSPRDFELVEALWRLGLLRQGELPRAAIAAIDSADAPESLFALAAFTHPDWNGIEEAFDRAWLDLLGQRLDDEECGRRVAVEIARFVCRGRMPLTEGLRVIDDVACHVDDERVSSLCMLQARLDVASRQPTHEILREAELLMVQLAGESASPGAQPMR